ncbi:UNVERIFIED_CONTAM: hypothetical protein DES50_102314 [Williamsia faeni]
MAPSPERQEAHKLLSADIVRANRSLAVASVLCLTS